MKFEMTRCNQCGSEMPMGLTVCPSCGKVQTGKGGIYQPRTMLAVGLAAAVLLFFNWIKLRGAAAEPDHFTSICKPSFSMMEANFLVSASTKSENCCGVP